jgi:hypothetical protein
MVLRCHLPGASQLYHAIRIIRPVAVDNQYIGIMDLDSFRTQGSSGMQLPIFPSSRRSKSMFTIAKIVMKGFYSVSCTFLLLHHFRSHCSPLPCPAADIIDCRSSPMLLLSARLKKG